MRMKPSCLFLAACLPWCAHAQEATHPFSTEWNLRLRHEAVDDAAFVPDADATTLRLRLGLRAKFADHWSALVEGEGIAAAGNYDSTANGKRGYPVIADAEGAELNQALVSWKNDRVQATVGRQRVQFGNQRWVGNSGWRQNEQTFDAFSFEAKPGKDWRVHYAFFDRVHRVNGDKAIDPLARERNLSTHAIDVAWIPKAVQLCGYALLHDDQDVRTASTATYGLRMTANRLREGHGPSIAAEYARQRDYADNPIDFSHDYWLVEPAYAWGDTVLRGGVEHLGGNGRHALQTPLATLHPFNGWADKFANATPPGGLEDTYASLLGQAGCAKCEWVVAWHDYRADTRGALGGHYGSEWDASFAFPVGKALTGLMKVADYSADTFARDTTKLWLQVEWKR